MAKKTAKPQSAVFHYEELEQRVLFSADIAPGVDTGEAVEQVVAAETTEPASTSPASDQAPEAAQAADGQRWELVLVNENVADYEQLIAGLQSEDGNRIFEVVVLDADRSGVEQVSDILAERSDLSAVHVITHGAEGRVNLGSAWLDSDALQANAEKVAGWGEALTDTGDILFYGCHIGDDAGRSFLTRFAELTGVDTAASDDTTGHSQLYGDWDLEIQSGHIDTQVVVSRQAQEIWHGALAAPSDMQAAITTDGGLNLNNDGGNDAYLEADDGGAILGGLSAATFELQFSGSTGPDETVFISYTNGAGQDEFTLMMDSATSTLEIECGYLNMLNLGAPDDYKNLLLDGNKHTLSFTWDNSAGDWAVYVDGQVTHSGSGLNVGATLAGGGILVFGQEQDGLGSGYKSTEHFSGTLYDARFFNDSRTSTEISANYNSSLPYDESGLIANWQFDNLSADEVVTETVSGNNLTLKHAAGAGYISSTPAMGFEVIENAIDGTVVGTVSGTDAEREALIASLLAADTDLAYNAETGKFYKAVSSATDWTTAQSNAMATSLNGVGGQLATIRSADEFNSIRTVGQSAGISGGWLGGSDADEEGVWRWYDGLAPDDQFAHADGDNVTGAYAAFGTFEPGGGGTENHLEFDVGAGQWNDLDGANSRAYFIEWNADTVLDATQSLTYSVQSQTVSGAFAIDADSGEISVADGSLLDYETNASHTLTVRVADGEGLTFDRAFAVSVNNLVEVASAPTALSSGIELNTDFGNDTYLVTTNGGTILGGLNQITAEVAFLSNGTEDSPALLSYATATEDNEFAVMAGTTSGTAYLYVGGTSLNTNYSFAPLNDGQMHHLAVTWDNTHGNWSLVVDGDQVAYGTGLATGHALGTGGTLVLGNDQDAFGGDFSTGQELTGALYDVRIWNEVRSVEDISLNHQHKFDGGSLPIGLIANWQMDGFDGSNEVVDVVGANNLSIGHAGGAGFISSTPVEDLNIDENATNGTAIGFILPTTAHLPDDIVSDGLFSEGVPSDSTQVFTNGQSFGSWTVENGTVEGLGGWMGPGPLGGVPLELGGTSAGTISQSLNTEVGKTYQITFALTGDFSAGNAVKNLRVAAAGTSADFQVGEPPGWTYANPLWEHRTLTFTADSTSTQLIFASLDASGPAQRAVITEVHAIEVPQAVTTILNNDATLSYDAATGKFYRLMSTPDDFNGSLSAATAAVLNGVTGQLGTIRSDYEQQLFNSFRDQAGADIWLGASDATTEGEWYWLDGAGHDNQFWTGGGAGSAVTGQYAANFAASDGAGENYLRLIDNGTWADQTPDNNHAYVIEWNATDVLGNFTFSLTDDAGGRFAIDTSSGEVTVANGALLNYEASTSHNITVEVTDAGGAAFNQALLIQVNDCNETPVNALPAPQITDEDTTLVFSTGNGNLISISDDAGDTPTLVITVGNGALSVSGAGSAVVTGDGTGSVTLSGSVADINLALDGLQYDPANDWNGSDALTITTTDGVTHALNIDVNLQGYYQFSSAGAGDDSSPGSLNDGTLNGNASVTFDATRGDVLSLDGDDDYLDITGPGALFGSPANVTLSAWVNYSSADTYGGEVISLGNNVMLRVDDWNEGVTGVYYDGSTWQYVGSQVSLADGQWHHIAFAFDDAGNAQGLYIDGVLRASDTSTASIAYVVGSNTRIGANASDADSDFDFNGLIDDARIYNRALSASEIAGLAAAPVQPAATGSVAITVNAINDAPVLDNSGFLTLTTITEDDIANNGNLISEILSSDGGVPNPVTDKDAGALEGIAIRSLVSGNGTWEYNTGTGWSPVDTVSDSNSLLLRATDRLRFVPDGVNADTGFVTFTAWDQTSGTVGTKVDTSVFNATGAVSNQVETAAITVTAVNDAPIIDLNGTNGAGIDFAVTFTEGDGAIDIVDTDVLISDVDGTVFQNLSVNLTDFFDGGSEQIIIDGYTFYYGVSDTVVRTIGSTDIELDFDGSGFNIMKDGSGTIPVADLQPLVASIDYQNTSQNPTPADRTIEFTIFDGAGLAGTTATCTVTVQADNDAPVVTTSAGATTYSEQAAAKVIDGSITLVDPDGFDGTDPSDQYVAVVQITGNYEAADILGFANTSNIQGVPSGNTLVLSVIGGQTATVAEFETALRSVTFYNGSNSPGELDRTVSFSFDDGVDSSNVATKTVEVTALNDSPVIGGDSAGTVTEDVDPDVDTLLETSGTLTIADPDTGESSFQNATIVGTYGSLTIDTAGNWSYSADNTQAAIQQLDAGESINDVITVTSADGTTHDVTITIDGAEDTPVIGGTFVGTVAEDGTLTANGTLSISDADANDNPIGFADVSTTAGDNGYGSFALTGGAWTYSLNNAHASVQALDAGESLTDTYTFTASDGSTQTVTITIDGAEDNPVIGGTFVGTVAEDGTLTANGTLSITDTDSSDNPIGFADVSTTAGDNGYGTFALTGGTWTYTLNNAHASVQALDAGESLTDTYTFTASDGSTQTVTITIDGAEDNPVIGGTFVGTVAEDGTLTANGTLSISDTDGSDNPISFADVAVTAGDNGYGSFALTGGAWTYTLNNGHASVQALDAGESLTDTYTFTASDGSTQTVTITIDGAEDAPVIGGTFVGTVAEDGTLTVNGTLSISDADTNDNPIGFADVSTTAGDNGYGSIALTGGAWIYTLNNGHASVQALDAGESLTDTYTFTATDGSTQTVTITINGAEDNPVIDGTFVGTVAEDGTLTANGTLSITDTDTNDNPIGFADVSTTAGDNGYGTFALTGGAWTYTLNNAHASVQALDAGESLTDTYTFSATDGSTQTVTITIDGTEDAPVIGGTYVGAVTEDGTLTANGTLSISDADTNDNPVSFADVAVTAGDNGYGSFALTGGAWTYTLNNDHASVQALDAGESLTDTYTFTATDGSTQTVTITINGAEDNPVIGGTFVGTVTEDGTLTANGTLSIADADANDNPIGFADVSTTAGDNGYGSFALTGGAWTYTLNNGHASVQALDAGESLSDTYTFTATDGSTQTVTVTINGAEDNPVIGGTFVGTVAEDGTLTANGTLSIADADANDNPISFADVSTTAGDNGYGSFALTGGAWTYTLNNGHASVQALDAGESLTDTYTFTATDGSTQTVTVTIDGAEDAPVIGGTFTGTATEDGTLTANGTLSISDVDTSDNPIDFADVATTSGDNGYGTFALTGGAWTYTLNNSHGSVQALDAGQSLTDTYTFTASDGSTQTVTVTIDGAEDAPVISGTVTGTVAEDGTLTANGSLSVSDTDSADNPISIPDVSTTVGYNGYGTFALTSGTWTYTLNNDHAAVQALDAGQSLSDIYTFTASDGTTQTVTVTINGAEDAPILTSAAITGGVENTAYNYTVIAGDVDGDALAFSAVSLPAWLTLVDNGDGTATLSGTPSGAEVGNHSVSIEVSDGTLSDTQHFTLSVSRAAVDQPEDDTDVVDGDDPIDEPEPEIDDSETDNDIGPGAEDADEDEAAQEEPDIIYEPPPAAAEDPVVSKIVPKDESVADIIYLTDEDGQEEASQRDGVDRTDKSLERALDKEIRILGYLDATDKSDKHAAGVNSPDGFDFLDQNNTGRNPADVEVDLAQLAIDESFQSELETQATKAKIVTITAASFTAGIVSYLLRAGSLAASLMSSIPLWRGFDPIAIFPGKKKRRKDRDGKIPREELKAETLFDGDDE